MFKPFLKMETKKTDRANLEKNRSMFFQMGLLLALGLAFVAFEWQVTYRISDVVWDQFPVDHVVIDLPINTFTPAPPPPPSAPPQSGFILDIVGNDVILDVFPEIIIPIENGFNILPTYNFAPTDVVEEDEPEIFCVSCVEEQALFNGKPVEEAFRNFVSQNLTFPQIAINHGISGKVFVQFVVDPQGNAVDVTIVRGVDTSLDHEAIRLIKSTSGMWTPAKQRGKAVKVRYTFPITFQLQ
jgi:protein TonB